MSMLKTVFRREIEEVTENNIRFQAIGHIAGLAPDVRRSSLTLGENGREYRNDNERRV